MRTVGVADPDRRGSLKDVQVLPDLLRWHKVKDPGGRTIGYTATGESGHVYNIERYSPTEWYWSDGHDFGRHQAETFSAARYQAQQREDYWWNLSVKA